MLLKLKNIIKRFQQHELYVIFDKYYKNILKIFIYNFVTFFECGQIFLVIFY